MVLKLSLLTGVPIFGMQFWLMDRRDEFQVCSAKSAQSGVAQAASLEADSHLRPTVTSLLCPSSPSLL